MNKIMILKGGSPALHKLGDISRETDDFIRIHSETKEYYIGSFEEGFGFIDVKFKKEDCRLLTEEERKDLNGKWYGINSTPLYRIYVDEQGNVINGKCIMKKGIITKVADTTGEDKPSNFIGLTVEFQEDITIGQSLILFTGDKYITTSKVTNFEIIKNTYVIYTKNSVYYISKCLW
jgi:hypothetical protein